LPLMTRSFSLGHRPGLDAEPRLAGAHAQQWDDQGEAWRGEAPRKVGIYKECSLGMTTTQPIDNP
jgi:hypothetical protein